MKKISILGGGISGIGAALLAKNKGFDVFLSDAAKLSAPAKKDLEKATVSFEEGQHTYEKIFDTEEIIKSPGIPESSEIIVKAKERGINVISELEFASRYTNAKLIAITGSNGKTTTSLLTYHILKNSGFKVGLAGNIGQSFALQVIEDKFDYYVLEVSSFQLDGMYNFKADVAVLLNITPDHLDRYDNDFQKYVDSKLRITQNQEAENYFIYFSDDKVISKELSKRTIKASKLTVSLTNEVLNGGFLKANDLQFNVNHHFKTMMQLDNVILPLHGKHNAINTISAVLAAMAAGVSEEQVKSTISSFKNVAHRLEDTGMINSVRFINDSKATNVDATKYAIDSFDKPIIWIVGGVDKGNDYSKIDELVYEKVKAIICLGKDNTKLTESFSHKIDTLLETDSMTEAVMLSNELAESGDIVLLSPCCASFDLFKNYEDRGEQFKKSVRALERKQRRFNN